MKLFKQMYRGCTTLPHVGDHPGTLVFLMYSFSTGLLCIENNGVIGFFKGSIIMMILLGPFYLIGAYQRAEYSDELTRKKNEKENKIRSDVL